MEINIDENKVLIIDNFFEIKKIYKIVKLQKIIEIILNKSPFEEKLNLIIPLYEEYKKFKSVIEIKVPFQHIFTDTNELKNLIYLLKKEKSAFKKWERKTNYLISSCISNFGSNKIFDFKDICFCLDIIDFSISIKKCGQKLKFIKEQYYPEMLNRFLSYKKQLYERKKSLSINSYIENYIEFHSIIYPEPEDNLKIESNEMVQSQSIDSLTKSIFSNNPDKNKEYGDDYYKKQAANYPLYTITTSISGNK